MVWFRWRLVAVVAVAVVVVLVVVWQTTKNWQRQKAPDWVRLVPLHRRNQEPGPGPTTHWTRPPFPVRLQLCDLTAHPAAWCVQVHSVLLQHFLYDNIVNIIFCNIFSPLPFILFHSPSTFFLLFDINGRLRVNKVMAHQVSSLDISLCSCQSTPLFQLAHLSVVMSQRALIPQRASDFVCPLTPFWPPYKHVEV